MLYQKKANESWTGLCIFFDENFWLENRNDEECYRILYLLYYMLACKKKYFASFKQYDEYAQLAANMIFMRFEKKKKAGLKVKSVLNYVKSTLYAQKVAYQNAEFRDTLSPDDSRAEGVINMMREQVQQTYNEGMIDDIIDVFCDIPEMVRHMIQSTPYKNDPVMSRRIYISCLITLIKGFTLNNDDVERLKTREEKDLDNTEVVIKMFNKERETSTTVWRLDSTMGPYIQVLANKIRKKIVQELSDVRASYTLNDEIIDAILSTAWEGVNHAENSEIEGD